MEEEEEEEKKYLKMNKVDIFKIFNQIFNQILRMI